MSRLVAVVALTLAAFTLSADVITIPPAPTTHSFVKLHVSNAWAPRSCNPEWWTMERSARTFDVRFTSEICIPQIGGWSHDIPLGVLEPGLYTARLWDNGELRRTYTFAVTQADAPVKVMAPYASTRGGTRVLLVNADGSGFPAGARVLIDGVEVEAERVGGALTVTAPAHAAGAVTVEVRTAGGATLEALYALRYVDPAAPVDTSVFERVLIPILYNGPGAFGSQWVTETKLEDQSEWFHDFERAACKASCSTPPSLSEFRDHPTGMIVTAPRQRRSLFSLRIRDISRTEISYGAEVPVVREEEFRRELLFPDVPFDSRYRVMLRLYSMSGVSTFADVYTAGPRLEVVRLIGPCPLAPCASVQPSFAAVDLKALLPAVAGAHGVSVYSRGLDPLWGFITVTNNATQQVTVISPMR